MEMIREFLSMFLMGVGVLLGIYQQNSAQDVIPLSEKRNAPIDLPGNGQKQYNFLYAGEGKTRDIYIVRDGNIAWSYNDTINEGEISDAVLMSNGNIVYAHQHGVSIIDQNKKVLWTYKPPQNCEIHTAQPIGHEHIVFVQNGDTINPPAVKVVNIVTGKFVKEFFIPVGNLKRPHGQFRHARLTDSGTYIVAHMDNNKVCEYDFNGKELFSIEFQSPWSAKPLKNGNLLITSNKNFIREVTRKGEIVWEFNPSDVPDYTLFGLQVALRLDNGNTIINSWNTKWKREEFSIGNEPVQFIEVTQDKKVVWALRSWNEPVNLGPSTILQLLDLDDKPEDAHFGDIR